MREGRNIDLSDCPYGETTGCSSFINRPTRYYYFLAGLVRIEKLTRVLEIGTNYGGSIMSIAKGLPEDDISKSRLVTVDIVTKNPEGFKKYPGIKRIKGDSLDEKVAREVVNSFNGRIDLLYIDSLHEYDHTKRNINIYSAKLKPRYVVLDDIRQCDDMKKLWNELKDEFKGDAFDASEVIVRIGAGFGVIRAAGKLVVDR